MRSRALAAAAVPVAREHLASVDSVILACTARLLAAASGQRGCGFLMLAHNRFDEDTDHYSGTLVQSFPVYVDVNDGPLDELVRQAHFAGLRSALSCHGNPDDVSAMLREVFGGDGAGADLSCAVNLFFPDLRTIGRDTGPAGTVTREQAESLMAGTRFVQGGGTEQDDWEFYLNAHQEGDEFVVSLRMDTAVLPSWAITGFLSDLERTVVGLLPDSRA